MRNVTFGLLALLLVAAPAAALSSDTNGGFSFSHGGNAVRADGEASANGDGAASGGLDGAATTEHGDATGTLFMDENGAIVDGAANGRLAGLADEVSNHEALGDVKGKLPQVDLPVSVPEVEDVHAGVQGDASKEEAGFAATLGGWLASLGAAFRGVFGF